MFGEVKVWQETITLPTWTTGDEDPNPMFLEKRVYQGSSGAVYPYGVIDTLSGRRENREYQAVWMENDFIRIMLLPELGGRIHRAFDKTKNRDFVYYNEVVKPALVGLLGPWISGGIEFNWPQHHRPTTFMPIDFVIQQRENGAQTVWMGEVEPMRGLQIMAGFTLYPDKALIEITGKVFNGNATPRHFLWWANPAVKAGDDHQSVFPPDVTAVFDHGKRAVSDFPIATGTYYKVDYSAGVDISRYKNVPVPTSYMAEKSEYDFVGAWHHGEQGGLLHVADHHISPGKKQWSWGYSDFGLAWDRNLTDENGPYIELMTGVFTDNQPDFTWLAPYEEKVFIQNFLPYSDLGMVQNASTSLALQLMREENNLHLGLYAIAPLSNIRVVLSDGQNALWETDLSLHPGDSWKETLPDSWPQRLTLQVFDSEDNQLLSYQEHQPQEMPLPSAAEAPEQPEAINNCDELYFIGQHLELYNHASRFAADYYRRAIEIDPYDYRNNVALGTFELNRADWKQAEKLARSALVRAHGLNKNPRNGEASMLLGAALERQERWDEAWDSYYKASWSGDCRDSAFWALAKLAMRKQDWHDALDKVTQSLRFNSANNLAMGLQAVALIKLGDLTAAQAYIADKLEEQPLSYALNCAQWLTDNTAASGEKLREVTGRRGANACTLAGWLLSMGLKKEAAAILALLDSQETLPLMWRAALSDDSAERNELVAKARQVQGSRVRFPNSLDEVQMLQDIEQESYASYLLGCFWYSKRRYDEAVKCWKYTLKAEPNFAPVHRLLAIYEWNKNHDAALAAQYLDSAVALDPENARFLFERDYLSKLVGTSIAERLAKLEAKKDVVLKRDDLTAELLSLWNGSGQYANAGQILATREFHPWEGGEGKVTGQYLLNQMHSALNAIASQDYPSAVSLLEQALIYPHNLGEGRLPGQTDNDIWYLLGYCASKMDQQEKAQQAYQRANSGESKLDAGRYYNDQPADYLFWQGMAKKALGQNDEAQRYFAEFVTWADTQRDAEIVSDFFAVSLPDLVVLDAPEEEKNQLHCEFISALGNLGLNNRKSWEQGVKRVLALNPAHDKTHLLLHALKAGIFN